jgi:Spy/CpxP family protein refolding chaperone
MEVRKMRKLIIAVVFLAGTFFVAGYALAQGSGHESRHGSMHQQGSVQQHEGSPQRHQESTAPGKDFSLTPEQKTKFQDLRRKFRLENAQLIGALVAKRIELHALWSDPKADPKAIMEKEKERASLMFHLREKIIQSKLEARQFLTPEQISHFVRDRSMGFRKIMDQDDMMGHRGMMHRRERTGEGEMCHCRMGSGHGMGHTAEQGEGHKMGHGPGHGMGGMGMGK